MKKLLLPLIILLLIIGYFMSRGSHHEAKDAYDSLNKPDAEQMENTTPPDSRTTPPDMESSPNGMGTDTPRQPDQPDTGHDSSLMHKAEDAAKDVGGAVDDAAKDAGRALKDAGEATKRAAEDAGEATKRAAEDAVDKMRGEDSKKEDSDSEDEPKN